jgi:transposase
VGRCKPTVQTLLDAFLPEEAGSVSPLDTMAVRESTSTFQTIESPGPSPSTVATDCGTVVFNDGDPATAKNALDSNLCGIDSPVTRFSGRLNVLGLEVGLPLAPRLKYGRDIGLRIGLKGARKLTDDVKREVDAANMAAAGLSYIDLGGGKYMVPSQSGHGYYPVTIANGKAACKCPDFERRGGLPCKHVFFMHRQLDPNPTALLDVIVEGPKKKRTRDYRAYDEGQKQEAPYFRQITATLMEDLVDPRPPFKRGQPRLPLRDVLFCAALKVRSTLAVRREYADFVDAANLRGLIKSTPSYPMPGLVLSREDVTPILQGLIDRVVRYLIPFEQDFAIDSSGFRTTSFNFYNQEAHGPSSENIWLKLHFFAGIATHAIIVAKVTEGHAADAPQFIELLDRVRGLGFRIRKVCADKAYLAHKIVDAIVAAGATPYIPGKSNTTGRAGGSPAFGKMIRREREDPEEFRLGYRLRVQAEATVGAIKAKPCETIRSRNPVAQVNELLMKVLVYDVTVLAHLVAAGKLDLSLFDPRVRSDGNEAVMESDVDQVTDAGQLGEEGRAPAPEINSLASKAIEPSDDIP